MPRSVLWTVANQLADERRISVRVSASGSVWAAARIGAGDLGWLFAHLAACWRAFRLTCRLGCRHRPGSPAGLIKAARAGTAAGLTGRGHPLTRAGADPLPAGTRAAGHRGRPPGTGQQ